MYRVWTVVVSRVMKLLVKRRAGILKLRRTQISLSKGAVAVLSLFNIYT
jgi:hypothetical protein